MKKRRINKLEEFKFIKAFSTACRRNKKDTITGHEIVEILNHKGNGITAQYEVKWANYNKTQWLYKADLNHCKEMLLDYESYSRENQC